MPDQALLPDAPPPSPPSGAACPPDAGLADWLGGLLDMARDRGDAPLARLIAGLADDLRAAAAAAAKR